MKRLMLIAALFGAIAFIARKAMTDREQWQGLTENDVRDRLDQRLPSQLPDEKRQAIADTIVTKMKDRGAISESSIDVDDTIDLVDSSETAAESTPA